MNKKELLKLIKKGETQKIGFKSNCENIGKDICAFANTNEGIVFVGVDDNMEIIGTKKKYESEIANIAHSCKPSVYPEIIEVNMDDKTIFVVKIKRSNSLYSFKNIAYKRVGTHNKPLSPEEVIESAKDAGQIRWDEQVCEGAALKDIDGIKVKKYLEKREKVRGKKKPEDLSLKQLLVNIKAISKDLKLTNAGILLFCKDPQKFIDVSEVRCARFKGTVMGEFIDSVDLNGSLFEMLEFAMKFIERNTRIASKVVGLSSQYKKEYPFDALREAIINAVIHRDYTLNSNIRIAIFDDRIEIASPGGLMPGLVVDKLEGAHELRNKHLAKFFYEIGEIEKWGSGIIKINHLVKEHGLKKPKYESNHQFKIVFYGPGEKILDLIEKPSELIELNERQKKAIEYLKENNKVSNKEYQVINNIPRVTAFRDLRDLTDKGIIRKIGKTGKYTYYQLKR